MDQINLILEPGQKFAKDSLRLVKRCTKPDRKGDILYCEVNILRKLLLIIDKLGFNSIVSFISFKSMTRLHFFLFSQG